MIGRKSERIRMRRWSIVLWFCQMSGLHSTVRAIFVNSVVTVTSSLVIKEEHATTRRIARGYAFFHTTIGQPPEGVSFWLIGMTKRMTQTQGSLSTWGLVLSLRSASTPTAHDPYVFKNQRFREKKGINNVKQRNFMAVYLSVSRSAHHIWLVNSNEFGTASSGLFGNVATGRLLRSLFFFAHNNTSFCFSDFLASLVREMRWRPNRKVWKSLDLGQFDGGGSVRASKSSPDGWA